MLKWPPTHLLRCHSCLRERRVSAADIVLLQPSPLNVSFVCHEVESVTSGNGVWMIGSETNLSLCSLLSSCRNATTAREHCDQRCSNNAESAVQTQIRNLLLPARSVAWSLHYQPWGCLLVW